MVEDLGDDEVLIEVPVIGVRLEDAVVAAAAFHRSREGPFPCDAGVTLDLDVADQAVDGVGEMLRGAAGFRANGDGDIGLTVLVDRLVDREIQERDREHRAGGDGFPGRGVALFGALGFDRGGPLVAVIEGEVFGFAFTLILFGVMDEAEAVEGFGVEGLIGFREFRHDKVFPAHR